MIIENNLFIRLYLDEDVHGDLGVILRQQGYDVLTVNEANTNGLSDAQQLAFAIKQNRTIFTFNASDFIALHIQYLEQKISHSGIIVSKQIPIKEAKNRLLSLLNEVTADEIYNQLRWL
jgi:predicted nuclease of predicted toxin-antitoxin system